VTRGKRMSSLRLFGEFGPPASRSYIYTPPKTRWWPILAAFVTGAVCVLVVRGLPQHRVEVTSTRQIYTGHDPQSIDYAGAVTTSTITRSEPVKFQEERPPTQDDQPAISPALEVIVKPTDSGESPVQARHSAAKGHHVTTKRHVARKSHRHERNDAYARYYDPGRNSYYGGYDGYWR
jgi:hypothetical protein